MSAEESLLDDIIPSSTTRENAEDRKPPVKPLYKLKIEDLVTIPFNKETNNFIFKNNEISLVMFGGKIESISSDDAIFSFYVSNGVDKVQCYHKRKECFTSLTDRMTNISHLNREFETEIINDISSSSDSDDEDIEETDIGSLNVYAEESKDIISDVLLWLNNEIIPVAAEKTKNIGDIIHVNGQLQKSDLGRKVSVMDFRIVKDEVEHEDFLLELEYFYKHLY